MSGATGGTSPEGKAHLVVGAQLRKARETVEFHLDEVAARLGAPREQIVRWESDRAKPTLAQLENLARLYGRDIDYFLKATPRSPSGIEFRSANRQSFRQLSAEARLVIAKFDELCRAALELEQTLGRVQRVKIRRVPRTVSPEDLGEDERRRLTLEDRPVSNLRQALAQAGIRIFELPVVKGEFSGFSYRHENYGPCILINANDSLGRRNFTLAHEFSHLLYAHPAWACDTSREGRPGGGRDERVADIFAIEFLLPQGPLRGDFLRRNLTNKPSLSQIGKLAGKWKVSVQAMLYRLEDLRLIGRGYAAEVLSSFEQPRARFGRAKVPAWRRRLGEGFVSNALEAYKEGYISLGKLARHLGLPLRKALVVSERHKTTC